MKDDDLTMANCSGRRMYMPDDVVAKVEVCVFKDGSCKVSNLPNDHIAGILLRLGLRMLEDDSVVDIEGVFTPDMITTCIGQA